MHAAASTVSWWGNDFNPSQASFAQSLAKAAQSTAQLFDESFAEFCTRPDLPDFDFIGLHGIWSWISDENRSIIVDFIRRKLKVGGVLYISYNTLPGWAAFAPMRHLLTEHSEVMGARGKGTVNRISDAVEFSERLLALNPTYAKANPQVSERINKLKKQNKHYLAHEYFNRDWHPMHFSKLADWLEPAKVQFACSANYLDHVDAINLTQEQQQFLDEITDPIFKQTTRDFIVNQQFRKDYWVKGIRKNSGLDQAINIKKVLIVLSTHKENIKFVAEGSLGEATLNADVYQPIIDALGDHRVIAIGDLEKKLGAQVTFAQLLQALMILIGLGHIQPVSANEKIDSVNKTSSRLNNHLFSSSLSSGDVSFLASPVTGGGFSLSRFQQIFLYSKNQGKEKPEEWAKYAWEMLSAQGQKLIKDGRTLETLEDNIEELITRAKEFQEKYIPILKKLQII